MQPLSKIENHQGTMFLLTYPSPISLSEIVRRLAALGAPDIDIIRLGTVDPDPILHRQPLVGSIGCDVSYAQGTIIWGQAAETLRLLSPTGETFVYAKLTEGTKADVRAEQNWYGPDNPSKHGVFKLPYHFYRQDSSPVSQLDAFLSVVDRGESDGPGILDLEGHPNPLVPYPKVEGVVAWARAYADRRGHRPWLYTNWNTMQRLGFPDLDEVFEELVVASWRNSPVPVGVPATPLNWKHKKPKIWQHYTGPKHGVAGISSRNLDLDVWYS